MLRNVLWGAFIAARGIHRRWRELDEFSALRPLDARLDLARRLQAQIRYFGSREDALPEWRDAARIQNPLELWRCWPMLPILTKDQLRSRFHPRDMRARLKLSGLVSSTGGSTGEPVAYLHDRDMVLARMAAGMYSYKRMGWRPGMPTICVWGSERDIGRRKSLRCRISGFLKNDYLVDGYKLGSHTVEKVVGLIERHRPVALYGFTSMLEFVAREILRSNIHVPAGSVAAAWNGGEMLFKRQAELFQEAFKTPILNFYGGRELGALAHQTSVDSPLWVLRPYNFLEIVKANGRPAEPGESGRLIWTSTACRGTPFLRYEMGDVGCYSTADCDASGVRAISELHGRIAGLLELPNGQTINCIYWNHLLKEFSEIHQFQAVLSQTGVIDLLLCGPGLSDDRDTQLRTNLKRFLCDVPVQIKWVQRIPLTREGKLVQVVRN